jgi:hypothetical protein
MWAKDEHPCFTINVTGTENVINACRNAGVRRVSKRVHVFWGSIHHHRLWNEKKKGLRKEMVVMPLFALLYRLFTCQLKTFSCVASH